VESVERFYRGPTDTTVGKGRSYNFGLRVSPVYGMACPRHFRYKEILLGDRVNSTFRRKRATARDRRCDPERERPPFGITAFFPAFNYAPSLPSLVEKTFAVLESCADDFEIIVVNDGSRDRTAAVLDILVRKHGPRLRVVTHETNRGYGAALRSGFEAATKDLVFYTDGDGQYDVAELPKLLALMAPDVGFVNGYKLNRSDPLRRKWIGSAYNCFARLLFGIAIRDIDCDFRLVRRRQVQQIRLESTSGCICVELVKKLEMTGRRVEEVGVSHYPRLHGKSQFFRFRSLLVTFSQLATLYWHIQPRPQYRRLRQA
jgi:glycosyltransferase involved in cell wall biosynthesis